MIAFILNIVLTVALLSVGMLIRNEMTYAWTKRALRAIRMDDYFDSDMAFLRVRSYDALLLDLRVWTFAQAFPELAKIEAETLAAKESA